MPPYLTHKKRRIRRILISASLLVTFLTGAAVYYFFFKSAPPVEEEAGYFIQSIDYPEWFASSVLNLPKDLEDALAKGKQGVALYFSRMECPCCEVMKEVNLENPAIADYMQRYFDVIAIDVWGNNPVTDFDGQVYNEPRFANLKNADATPSILFFNAEGKEIFRLRGYYGRYTFQAVLDFVLAHQAGVDFNQYQSYLFRPEFFDDFDLHPNKYFLSPPYLLDRSKIPAQRPLLVLFEQGDCAGCDFLHAQLLNHIEVVKNLALMDVVQLDISHPTPLVTPAGEETNSRAWAEALNILYTPTLLLFDQHGNQISRLDSSIALHQLAAKLDEVVRNQ